MKPPDYWLDGQRITHYLNHSGRWVPAPAPREDTMTSEPIKTNVTVNGWDDARLERLIDRVEDLEAWQEQTGPRRTGEAPAWITTVLGTALVVTALSFCAAVAVVCWRIIL